MNKAMRDRLKELIASGVSYSQAGKELGLSTSQAYYWGRVKAGKSKRRAAKATPKPAKSSNLLDSVQAVMSLPVSNKVKEDIIVALVRG